MLEVSLSTPTKPSSHLRQYWCSRSQEAEREEGGTGDRREDENFVIPSHTGEDGNVFLKSLSKLNKSKTDTDAPPPPFLQVWIKPVWHIVRKGYIQLFRFYSSCCFSHFINSSRNCFYSLKKSTKMCPSEDPEIALGDRITPRPSLNFLISKWEGLHHWRFKRFRKPILRLKFGNTEKEEVSDHVWSIINATWFGNWLFLIKG